LAGADEEEEETQSRKSRQGEQKKMSKKEQENRKNEEGKGSRCQTERRRGHVAISAWMYPRWDGWDLDKFSARDGSGK